MILARYKQGRLTSLLLCWTLFCARTHDAESQDASRVTITGEAGRPPSDKMRFRIDWGITNVEYRRQALALTPLGTPHEDVKAFVTREWQTEKRQLTWSDMQRETELGKDFVMITKDIVRDQTPHVSVTNPNNLFAARGGRLYMCANLIYKPVGWRPAIDVSIIYVFDKHKKLIDLFCQHSAVKGYNPWAEF